MGTEDVMPLGVTKKGFAARPGTYRVTLGYDGGQFAGFAQQPGLQTVEGVLRSALAPLVGGGRFGLAVGGRTDRGVHALGQVVSFKLRPPRPVTEVEAALAGVHPGVWIENVQRAPHWFHAHFSARTRHYVYLASASSAKGFDEAGRLQRLLLPLLGRRCFTAFARDTPFGQSTERRLIRATVRQTLFDGQPKLQFDLVAESFLRRMVRVLVATALRSAHEGASDDHLVRLAAAGDRRATAHPAPPGALYLRTVSYGPEPVGPRR